MDGVERDGLMGSFSVRVLVRKVALEGDIPVSGVETLPAPSVSLCRIMAGSRLRVWRSLRLAIALDAGEEQEKTLLRSP